MADIIGKYRIRKEIGKGGMGRVYLAQHPELKQDIILKELRRGGKEFTQRFKREAQITMGLAHENIASVFDFFTFDNKKYIAMEYVDGIPLSDFIAKHGQLDFRLAMMIFSEMASGLAYAHDKKVLHRDLKPHNVMISKKGQVKIIDFGIASVIDDDAETIADANADTIVQKSNNPELTQTGVVMGTPAYMSPEQMGDMRNVTAQSDIFSLGVMLFEMVTGERPFTGGLGTESVALRYRGKYEYPGELATTVPAVIRKVITKCLKGEQSKRFSSMKAAKAKFKKFMRSFSLADRHLCISTYIYHDQICEQLRRMPPVYSSFLKSFSESYARRSTLALILFHAFVVAPGIWLYKSEYRYKIFQRSSHGGMEIVFNLPLPRVKRLPNKEKYPGLYKQRSARATKRISSFIDTYYRDLLLNFQLRAWLIQRKRPGGRRISEEEILLTPKNYLIKDEKGYRVDIGKKRKLSPKFKLSSGTMYRPVGYYSVKIQLHGRSYWSEFPVDSISEKNYPTVVITDFQATPQSPVTFAFKFIDDKTGKRVRDVEIEFLDRISRRKRWKAWDVIQKNKKYRERMLNGQPYYFRYKHPDYKGLKRHKIYATRHDRVINVLQRLEPLEKKKQ